MEKKLEVRNGCLYLDNKPFFGFDNIVKSKINKATDCRVTTDKYINGGK